MPIPILGELLSSLLTLPACSKEGASSITSFCQGFMERTKAGKTQQLLLTALSSPVLGELQLSKCHSW